jgi:hypothetical protein
MVSDRSGNKVSMYKQKVHDSCYIPTVPKISIGEYLK